MDALTFVSNLVKSLAWPITVVVLALVFRNRLSEVLHRLIEFRFHGVSVRLDSDKKALKEARAELQLPHVQFYPPAERAIPRWTSSANGVDRVVDRQEGPVELVAAEAPKAPDASSVLDPLRTVEISWQELRIDLLKKARELGAARLKKPDSVVAFLEGNGAVPDSFRAAFERVRAVHDNIRHPGNPLDAELAADFQRTCDKLRQYLNS